MRSIAERYCSLHNLPEAAFARRVLTNALTLQAQLAYPVLRLVPGFFAADLEFIHIVGRAASLRDFAIDAADFSLHPDNQRLTRRWLRLRISSRKLRRHLVHALNASSARSASART
jgi:hypothetical protein